MSTPNDSVARRPGLTKGGADVLADCDTARQQLIRALDNLDTIERLARRTDITTAVAITGKITGKSLTSCARAVRSFTEGAVQVLEDSAAIQRCIDVLRGDAEDDEL